MNTFKISKTYQTVTPESAEHGDYHETGFVFEDKELTIDELEHELNDIGHVEWDSSTPRVDGYVTSIDPDTNIMTGEETFYSLHFELTEEQLKEVKNLLVKLFR